VNFLKRLQTIFDSSVNNEYCEICFSDFMDL